MFSRIIGSFRPCVFQILKLRVSWWHLSPNKKTLSDYDESEPIKYPQCFRRTQHKQSVWSKRPQKAPFGRKWLTDFKSDKDYSERKEAACWSKLNSGIWFSEFSRKFCIKRFSDEVDIVSVLTRRLWWPWPLFNHIGQLVISITLSHDLSNLDTNWHDVCSHHTDAHLGSKPVVGECGRIP